MESICLNEIKRIGNRIEYIFDVSDGLDEFFCDYPFFLEYPDNIELVPDGIAVIPFMTSVLPIMWISGCKLIISELDLAFYNCIPEIKRGYENMYPGVSFAGELVVLHLCDCATRNRKDCSALFYSGGLDSAVSMLRQQSPGMHLISIWGSDVDCENKEGWIPVETGIKDIACQYGLNHAVIRSSFRRFDNSIKLTEKFGAALGTSWWYGIKHGLGIIGHAAPYVWIHNIGTIYIASSNCVHDGKQKCASDPTIDNFVRFSDCIVMHDAYEMTRQDKIEFLVRTCRAQKQKLHLHVCWKSEDGDNCCACEKCYRTMVGLWIEGEDPRNYGFSYGNRIFERIYQLIALRYKGLPGRTWSYMQKRLSDNQEMLEENIRQGLSWMRNFDFMNEDSNTCRKKYERTWRFKRILVNHFPALYKLYVRLRGYRFE